jgi:hypothetical protein
MRHHASVAALLTVGLAAAAFASAAAADTKYKACSRLTDVELSAALNAPVSKTRDYDIDIPSGPYKGAIVSSCTWVVGRSFVNLNIMPAARTPDQRAEGLKGIRRQDDVLRQQGYTVVPANIAGAECNTFTPPATSRNPTPSASCAMVSKGMQFWLGVKGPLTVQQVKALADRVAARLP